MLVPAHDQNKKEIGESPSLIPLKQLKIVYWTLFYSIGAISALAVFWHNKLSHPGLCPIMILFAIESITWAWLSSESWRRDVW